MSTANVAVFGRPSLASVERLLADAGLPTTDLTTAHLETFFGIGSPDALDGVVGLELFGDAALLRSLAVAPAQRSLGLGKTLVNTAERHARSKGATDLYLLTSTAERFFAGLGYVRADRNSAPESIRQTREFAALCPASAAFMVKYCVPGASAV